MDKKLKQARNMLFGAVFGLFIMVAVWGITNFIASNLGITLGGCVSQPSPIPGQSVTDNCNRTTGSSSGTGTGSGTGSTSGTGGPIDQNEIDRNGEDTSIINGLF